MVSKAFGAQDTGYAMASSDGKIMMTTVYGTRRGAIVNWLCCSGFRVSADTSDQLIEHAYQSLSGLYGVEVVEVEVRVIS